jgi:hypothetical protein
MSQKSVTFERNERSGSAGTAGHVQAESAVTMVRNMQLQPRLCHDVWLADGPSRKKVIVVLMANEYGERARCRIAIVNRSNFPRDEILVIS